MEGATATIGATAAAVGNAIVLAYPIIESIVRNTNARRAAELRKDLDQVLSKFNVKLDQLRKQLELKGINYNQLMDKLNYVAPGGGGDQARRKAEKQYREDVDTINSAIADTTDKMNQYAALENEKIAKTENRGLIRTIFNG